MATAAIQPHHLYLAAAMRQQHPPARESLAAFMARMFAGYTTSAYITNDLIPALEWAVTTPDARLIITMPPRHSKSLHVSEHLPAWFLGNHPDKRIIAASHTASLAYTFSRRVRNKMHDPRWPFPSVHVADDKGAVQAWDIDGRQGGYIAVGVGGSPTGHGGHLIVIDDPIRSAADADSETIRDGLWEWYRETLRTRLEPGGSIIITATRWHEDDLTGRLLAEQDNGGEAWRHVHMPALSDAGAPLWPERWDTEKLDRIRVSVGSRAWEAQYQGHPVPVEGGILKHHWFRYWQYAGMNLPPVETHDAEGHTIAHPVMDLPGFFHDQLQSWDFTFKETRSGSYVVGLQAGVFGALTFLLDRYRERTDFPGSITAIRTMNDTWPETTIKLIEDKANGPAIMDTLRAHLPGIVAVEPSGTKEARMHAGAWYVEGGNLILPHPRIAPWVDDFTAEVTSFPMGAHDDQADALSQLVRRVAAEIDGSGQDILDSIWAGQYR
jgi:predicted phage terminase large subunit-like protein